MGFNNSFGHSAAADEAALITRLRAGDEQAFEVVVGTFGGQLLAVARRFVRQEEDARDIVQTAYLSAFARSTNSKGTAGCPPGCTGLWSTPPS